jgi:hypothetical protein
MMQKARSRNTQERALALDDAEAARRLFCKQIELGQILDDDSQTDPVKQEALRDLEAIYDSRSRTQGHPTSERISNSADGVRLGGCREPYD